MKYSFWHFIFLFLFVQFVEALPVITPPLDNRKIEFAKLSNGIPVIAVQDMEADSGVVLYYDRGSIDNPRNYQGLAHFLEHMLFIKNEVDPEIDPLIKFTKNHQGISNAMTGPLATIYFFSVESEYLPELIRKVGNSVVKPSLDPNYIDREVNAVNSECEIAKKNDLNILNDILSEQLNAEHPFSMFFCGNKKTLTMGAERGDNFRALRQFHNEHYGPATLRIGVFGHQEPQKLIEYLEEYFGAYKHEVKTRKDFNSIPLYKEKRETSKLIKFVQQKNQFYFTNIAVPIENNKDLKRGMNYLVDYFNRTDAGSLDAELKSRNLAFKISCAYQNIGSQSLFMIGFAHEENPEQRSKELLELCYAYLEKALSGTDHVLFDRVSADADFQWSIAKPSTSTNAMIAYLEHLDQAAPEDLLQAGYKLTHEEVETKLPLLRQNLLNPGRWIIFQTVDALHSDYPLKSRLDAPYTVGQIKVEQNPEFSRIFQHSSQPTYSLPSKDVVETENMTTPLLLKDNIYYWTNSSYQQPFVHVAMFAEKNKNHQLQFQEMLAIKIFSRQAEQFLAEMADVGFRVDLIRNEDNIQVNIGGFRSHFVDLNKNFWSYFKNFKFDPAVVEQEKTNLLKKLQTSLATSESLVFQHLAAELENFELVEMAEVIQKITLEDVIAAYDHLLDVNGLKTFIGGNLTKTEAELWSADVLGQIPFGKENIKEDDLPPKKIKGLIQKNYTYNSDKHTVYAGRFFEITNENFLRNKILLDITDSIFSPLAFEYLRTEEQLGYDVSLNIREDFDHDCFIWGYFVISDRYDDKVVLSKIAEFEKKIPDILQGMSEEKFEAIRNSLIKSHQIPSSSLTGEFHKQKSLLFYYDQQFDWEEKIVDCAATIKFDEWRNFVLAAVKSENQPAFILTINPK